MSSELDAFLSKYTEQAPKNWSNFLVEFKQHTEEYKQLLASRHQCTSLSDMREFVEKAEVVSAKHKKMSETFEIIASAKSPLNLLFTIFSSGLDMEFMMTINKERCLKLQSLGYDDPVVFARDFINESGKDVSITWPHPSIIIIRANDEFDTRQVFLFSLTHNAESLFLQLGK